MLRVLFLNGPPGSGKDEAANTLWGSRRFCRREKFSYPLRWAIEGFFGVADAELEEWKRRDPRIRQLMIGLSEDVVKPLYGPALFGKLCAERILTFTSHSRSMDYEIVVSDAGFEAEIVACVKTLEEAICSRVEVWQIHRPGCTFEGDSRSFVQYGAVTTRVIENDGTLNEFRGEVLRLGTAFFGPPKG